MVKKETYEELVRRVKELEIKASKHKKATEKLKESEHWLKVQYKHIPIPTYTWRRCGEDLALLDFNDAAEKITQGRIVKYVGMTAREIYKEVPEIFEELTRCFSQKTVNERVTRDQFMTTGEERTLNVRYAFVPPDSVVVHTEDITARVEAENKLRESYDLLKSRVKERTGELAWTVDRLKEEVLHREQVEEALRDSEERFGRVVQDMNCLLCRFLPEGTLTFVNERCCTCFNRASENLIGQNFFQFIPEQDKLKVREKLMSLTQEKPMITYEHQVIAPDGSTRWHECTYRAIINEEGRVKEYQSMGLDITARKQAEQSLQHAKTLLEKTLASIDKAVFVINPITRTIISCNSAVERVSGYTPEEVIGRSTEFLHLNQEMCERFGQKVGEALGKAGVYRGEFKMRKKDGTIIVTENTVREIDDDLGHRTACVCVVGDIAGRKKTEHELLLRGEQLEEKTKKLERLNTALDVLLEKRDQDRKYLEDKVLSNMKQLVAPALEKLKACGLNERGKTYLGIVQSNLNDIVSPFVHRLSEIHLGLTPTEIQVANFVKGGKTSKEIADLMSSSVRAVEFHREKLRKKLGLKGKKINLRSYLLSAS